MSNPTQLPLATAKTLNRQVTRRGVLWVGLRCDVRCKFCYDEHVKPGDKIWIPLEQATQTLDKFRSFYQNEFVDLMGGEPTLHPHIIDIVRYAARINLRPTVITHAMHLADADCAKRYADAGIHDFLISIHGLGDTVRAIHRRGKNNFARQLTALENLRHLGIPFRFNCTVIRDNLAQLIGIVELAAEKGARVINFLTFNPYFEWTADGEIEFQARHSESAPHLKSAITRCLELGIEANVRYMPLCQLSGFEAHVYTGYQLPYDPHEWDYNSWYDFGQPGVQPREWYLQASRTQQNRHHYKHVPACDSCAAKDICDGFHAQYLARWGDGEATPLAGSPIADARHFINDQQKIGYIESARPPGMCVNGRITAPLTAAQFNQLGDNRAGVKSGLPSTSPLAPTS